MKVNKFMKVKGDLKDRGRIKWTAMMLTEHVEMLKDWQKEDRYNTKPQLDDFDLESIYEEIRLAYMRQCYVELQLWQGQVNTLTGLIAAINLHEKTLCLEQDGFKNTISFENIIGTKTIE
jgi:hypothetical protein